MCNAASKLSPPQNRNEHFQKKVPKRYTLENGEFTVLGLTAKMDKNEQNVHSHSPVQLHFQNVKNCSHSLQENSQFALLGHKIVLGNCHALKGGSTAMAEISKRL